MHRIPVVVDKSKIYQMEGECSLVRSAVTVENISMAEVMFEAFENVAKKKQETAKDVDIMQQINFGLDLSEDNIENHQETLDIMNDIILTGPISINLVLALRTRGFYFLDNKKYQEATNDFEYLLHILLSEDFKHTNRAALCYETYAALIFLYYRMEWHEKCGTLLHVWNAYKNYCDNEISLRYYKLILFIERNIEKEYLRLDFDAAFYDPICATKQVPIKNQMHICFKDVIENKNTSAGVRADRQIELGTNLLLFNTPLKSLNVPYVQCEYCFKPGSAHVPIYTCLKCRVKTYCSAACIRNDFEHQNECEGYKNKILLILDTVLQFRIFAKLFKELHKYMFNQTQIKYETNADSVWKNLQKLAKDKNHQFANIEYRNFLSNEIDYKEFTESQLSNMLTSVIRLTVYVFKYTAIPEYCNVLNLDTTEITVLVSALLMRIEGHIMKSCIDFEYEIDLSTDETKTWANNLTCAPNKQTNRDIFNTEVEEDIKYRMKRIYSRTPYEKLETVSLPNTKHSKECFFIQRPFSTFKDRCIQVCFNPDQAELFLHSELAIAAVTKTEVKILREKLEATLNSGEILSFMKSFAEQINLGMPSYFEQFFKRRYKCPQVMSVVCELRQYIKHSCDPNAEFILLEGGALVLKLMRNIEIGEEICVNYKCHFLRHTQKSRADILQSFGIRCQCKYCTMTQHQEPINQRMAIICKCGFNITPMDEICPNCRQKSYSSVAAEIRRSILLIEGEMVKRTFNPPVSETVPGREIFVLNFMNFFYAHRKLSKSNEFRIQADVQFAELLARENLVKEAYKILPNVLKSLEADYKMGDVCFSFIKEIQKIIASLITHNVGNGECSAPQTLLTNLSTLGSLITQDQLRQADLYQNYSDDMLKIVKQNFKMKICLVRSLVSGSENNCSCCSSTLPVREFEMIEGPLY